MKECDFCNNSAKVVCKLGETSGWVLCLDHLREYQEVATMVSFWVNAEAVNA